jgi:glycosyltransferase involved in cell wall biosynthesis
MGAKKSMAASDHTENVPLPTETRPTSVHVLLTIAVPTYNRAGTVRETLDSIIGQLHDGVEMVVSDNASTDATQDIVRQYQAETHSLSYFRNETNVGADRNFDLAVRRAQGEYVWLLSDDDKLRPGAIERVLSVLKGRQDLALVFVNWATYDAALSRRLTSRALAIPGDVLCRTADEFLQLTRELASYVSSCVVRRDLWIELDLSQYDGSNYLQFAARLALLRGHVAYCLADPCVLYRGETFRSDTEGLVLRYNVSLARMVDQLTVLGYTESSVRRVLCSLVRHLPGTIFNAKITGLSLDCRLVRDLAAVYGFHPSFWFVSIPRLVVPCWIYKLVWRLYQVPLLRRAYQALKTSLRRLCARLLGHRGQSKWPQ